MSNAIQFIDRSQCPLCNSVKQGLYIGFNDIPVVRCNDCGFIYSKRLMSPKTLNDYYQTNFGGERHRHGQLINAKINELAIKRLLPVHDLSNFLDVGTGYGYLPRRMIDHYGWNAVGVELSVKEADYGRSILGVDIRNGLLTESGLSLASFDLVTCFEVIEHIAEPLIFVDELLSYVKPGGYLLVMTDNFESGVVKALGAGFPKWIPHSHISHFGPMTLEKTFCDKGVDIIGRLSYTPWELWARCYSSKWRGIRFSAETAFNLDEIMASEMSGEYRLFHLRRLVNSLWMRATARNDLNGALIYLVGRRKV